MTKSIESAAHLAARPRRPWPLAFGVVALLGIGGSSLVAAAHADTTTQIERLDLRNPAVLRDAHERGQIADWAAANHLTGLSPASLRPLPVPTSTPSRLGPR
jgi:hypothetical protein